MIRGAAPVRRAAGSEPGWGGLACNRVGWGRAPRSEGPACPWPCMQPAQQQRRVSEQCSSTPFHLPPPATPRFLQPYSDGLLVQMCVSPKAAKRLRDSPLLAALLPQARWVDGDA